MEFKKDDIKNGIKNILLMLLLTCFLWIPAIYNLYNEYSISKMSKYYIETEGVISKIRIENEGEDIIRKYTLDYYANGKKYELITKLPSKRNLGDNTPIIYDPTEPSKAYSQEKRKENLKYVIIVLGICLIINISSAIIFIKSIFIKHDKNKFISKAKNDDKYKSVTRTYDGFGSVTIDVVESKDYYTYNTAYLSGDKLNMEIKIPKEINIDDFIESRNDMEKILKGYSLIEDQLNTTVLKAKLLKESNFIDKLFEITSDTDDANFESKQTFEEYINNSFGMSIEHLEYDENLLLKSIFCYGYVDDKLDNLGISIVYKVENTRIDVDTFDIDYD